MLYEINIPPRGYTITPQPKMTEAEILRDRVEELERKVSRLAGRVDSDSMARALSRGGGHGFA